MDYYGFVWIDMDWDRQGWMRMDLNQFVWIDMDEDSLAMVWY